MTRRCKVGDHVTWNSDAGHVSGKIIKVHENVDDEVYIPTSKEDPRYENRERRPTVSRCSKGGCQKGSAERSSVNCLAEVSAALL
ncbi:MAG TPA: DUF2945 domain-containing protein [Candidatus Binatia bacterium]